MSTALAQTVTEQPPAQAETGASVVLFDGVCNLCNGFVNWVIDRDPGNRFRFVPLQSPAGRAMLTALGRTGDGLGTIVLVEQGRGFVRSEAALRIMAGLRTPLRFSRALLGWLPAGLRDLGYRLVAANRYRLFGARESCRMPTPELRSRFLDADDADAVLRVGGLIR
jgi:predicted DCC family thiol-disulfide oxidoreductase YuxK